MLGQMWSKEISLGLAFGLRHKGEVEVASAKTYGNRAGVRDMSKGPVV